MQYILYTVRTWYSYGTDPARSFVYTAHALVACSIGRPPKWPKRMREALEGLQVLLCSQSSIWKHVCDPTRAVITNRRRWTQTSCQPHRRKPIPTGDFFLLCRLTRSNFYVFVWQRDREIHADLCELTTYKIKNADLDIKFPIEKRYGQSGP